MNMKRIERCMVILVSAFITLQVVGAFAAANGSPGENELSTDILSRESITEDDEIKRKTVYLHNETGTVHGNEDVRTMNTTMGIDQHLTDWDYGATITHDWYLNPPFADDFMIEGNISMFVWINIAEPDGHTNTIHLSMDLYEVSTEGDEYLIAQGSRSYDDTRTIFIEYSVTAEVDEYLVPADSSLKAEFSIESSTNFVKRIAYGDSEYPSRLEMDTSTYIKPVSLKVLDSEYNESYSFKSGADDTTIHFNTTVTDPFGGYDIWNVFIALEGPEGTVFEKEEMTRTSGNYTSYESNYTYSWNYSSASEGDYLVTVSAVDMSGYHYRYPDNPGDETYGGHLESMSKTFWIGEERFYVHFQTIDSLDGVMEGAVVSVYTELGVYVRGNITDHQGVTNISISAGTYIIRVYWQDVVVNETAYPVTGDVSYDDPVVMMCSVYTPIYKVVDVGNQPIRSANIYMGHPNGTLLRLITDDEGCAYTEQMAGGYYTLRTEWLGREVHYTDHDLDFNGEYVIEANVFYLDITTIDTEGYVVPEVHVSVRFNDTGRIADAKLTDINGELTVRLPGTQQGFGYDMIFQWRGVEVGRAQDEYLVENRSIIVTLEIYYVVFETVDSLNLPLENTRLLAYNVETGTLANSGVTDEFGRLPMRLPVGPHNMVAYWRGIHVAEEVVDVPGTVDVIVIECEVYHVDFLTVDSQGEPLSNARITVSHVNVGVLTSGVTDENGMVSMRLPGALLDIEVYWKDAMVFSDSITINANEEIVLVCSVYYLQVYVIDDLELELENALVEIYRGDSLLESQRTDDDGSTPEMRLPGIEMEVRVYWKSVEVYSDTILLEEDTIETLQVAVYHITFLVEDDLGEALGDAGLNVFHGKELLHSDVTNAQGESRGRIPGAMNRVTVEWKNVVVYDSEINFHYSGLVVIEVQDVYHVTFRVADSRNIPVEMASVQFFVDEHRFDSGITTEDGMISVRVPTPVGEPGDIRIIIRWRDVLVYDEVITVEAHALEDSPIALDTGVYYVDYTVLDQRRAAVENAKVIGTHGELPQDRNIITDRFTDEEGYILFRLPRGANLLTVHWKDIVVRTDSLELTEDIEIEADADIYYISVNVFDDRGIPLESAHVRLNYVDTPRLYQSNYTDTSGHLEIRIPAASWDIEINWLKTLVHEGSIDVTSDEGSWNIQLDAQVYYLTVRIEDRRGDPLDDVHLKISAGDMVWTGYTEEGQYIFRLPARGDYELKASLRTTYLLTNVDIVEGRQITLTGESSESVEFGDYPTPIYRTNLFLLILLLLVMIFILFMEYSRAGSTVVYDEDYEEAEDEEAEDEEAEEAEDEEDR